MDIAAVLDGRCHRDGQKSREYWQGSSRSICRGLLRQLQTDGVHYEDISLELERVRHVWPSVPSLSSLENGDDANYPLGQPWSSIPEDDIKSGEAASAAAMRRVTGARSDETRSEFGAEAEQQRDEEGMPRRRDRTQLEVDKEVPTLDNQGTIFRIHVKPWRHATAGNASDVQRRWSATFAPKVGAREVSLSGLRDTKK